jgi:uncharacterized PurR-regulated membrane protein YhhQ (DUF165 family)
VSVKAKEGVVFFIGFIATIFLANWFIKNVGTECHGNVCLIPMWPSFGIGDGMVPSGVLWAGLALTLRDLVQRRLGVMWAWVAIIIGAVFSAWLDPFLALASGVAFLVAETLDMVVYTPLQSRNLFAAVIGSNIVGLIADSLIFLYLAGIPMIYAEGQVVGKLWMTLLALPAIWLIRKWDTKRKLKPA